MKHGAVAIRSDAFGDNQGSKNDWVMMNFMVCTYQILSNRMKIEMGWAYGTHGRKEICIQGLVDRSEGKNHLEDLVINGMTLLKWAFK